MPASGDFCHLLKFLQTVGPRSGPTKFYRCLLAHNQSSGKEIQYYSSVTPQYHTQYAAIENINTVDDIDQN